MTSTRLVVLAALHCFFTLSVRPQDSLTISEVMFDPLGSEATDEFIELHNYSTSQVFDLNGWAISDGSSYDKLIGSEGNRLLEPGMFAVIFDWDYEPEEGSYNHLIPADALVMHIDGPTFGSGGMLNSVAERVLLLDTNFQAVSEYTYSPDNPSGFSDEKILPAAENIESFWANSLALHGSPGSQNTVTPVLHDLSICSTNLIISPLRPQFGREFEITIPVSNKGTESSLDFSVMVYSDSNSDSLAQDTELLQSFSANDLAAGDTLVFRHMQQVLADTIILMIFVSYVHDQRLDDNWVRIQIPVSYAENSIVINEIMSKPSSAQSEFVELYNSTSYDINLAGWSIADKVTRKSIAKSGLVLPSEGYIALTGDSSMILTAGLDPNLMVLIKGMPSLNNDEDVLVITDATGKTIDSVFYFDVWGGATGSSLERVDPHGGSNASYNWTTCIAETGSTPAARNSIVGIDPAPAGSLVINEIMYDPLQYEPEWVEFVNPTDRTINLLNWTFQVGTRKITLMRLNMTVEPNQYVLLKGAESLPPRFVVDTAAVNMVGSVLPLLPNAGAEVILRDLTGNEIDRLNYSPNWGGGPGISLEKKRPAMHSDLAGSWGSNVLLEGGTPGGRNSIFSQPTPAQEMQLSVTPNPFVYGEASTVILVSLPVDQARVTLRIYDRRGRLIRTLLNNSPTGSIREVKWDGTTKHGHPARLGVYVAFAQAISEARHYSATAKKVLVLGKRF